jgi:putative hemolysin
MEQALNLQLFYTEIVGFIISVLACALLSFLETSITALRLFKLKELEMRLNKYKSLLSTLEHSPHQVLVTILIASNIANVTAAALITNVMETLFAQLNLSGSLGFSLGIGIATTAILVFGEIIPKGFAKVHGEKLFSSTLWITNVIYYSFYPLVIILMKFSNFVVALFGGSGEMSEYITSERELIFLIEYISEKGLMEREKTEMLQRVFKLGSKQVKEIMVPAIDIIMIDSQTPLQEALEVFSQYQFSRLPVYEGKIDNIIGMVHQKDIFVLLSKGQEKPVKELVRPILFIPESMKINQLLREFRQERKHIAIVLNEYGIITGLVTLEDVLEEIVGEISDEYEAITEKVIALESGGWLADGSVDLETISKLLGIRFEDAADIITLGGFLTAQLQHLPKKGEIVSYKGYQFYIQKASTRRVSQVLIYHNGNQILTKS